MNPVARYAGSLAGVLVLVITALLTALTAAGCSTPHPGASGTPAPGPTASAKPVESATPNPQSAAAVELDRILAGDQRSASDRARDAYRHPKETLLFFGVRPDLRIVEAWPEPGWYTEVIAPLVEAHGKYYAAVQPQDPHSRYISGELDGFRDKLAARPDLYSGVEITTLGPQGGDIAPPGSIDLVLTFRNVHDWMAGRWAPEAFAAMYRALKPGGVLGVVEHRGKPGTPQDPRAKSGYVNEDYAIALIEAAGFKLAGRSEINANLKDTKDYPHGVWTLPPTYRLGDKDRAVYAAIGESDRFTLRFVKPALAGN